MAEGLPSHGGTLPVLWRERSGMEVSMKQIMKMMRISRKDILLIVVGSGLMAFASKWIYDPCGLVIGGVTGLSILIKWTGETYLGMEIPLWVTTVVFNIPLMLLAWKLKGFSFIYRVMLATGIYSVWLAVLPEVTPEPDLVLAAVFGAVLSGTGVGLVFRAKATTGGSETVATLLWPRMKQYSVVQILQVIDGMIVALGVFAFGIYRTLYAIAAVYVASRVSDRLLEGLKFAKQAFVVTEKPEEVAEQIIRMERGVTGLRALGMYSGADKIMLYCVVSKKEIITLKELVHKVDANAFLVVSDAREVLGEGFMLPEEDG